MEVILKVKFSHLGFVHAKACSIYTPSNPGALSSSKDCKQAFKEERKKNHSYPPFKASLP